MTELTQHMITIAKKRGKLLLEDHSNMKVETKTSRRDLVSEMDVLTQQEIISYLRHSYPKAEFFAEENAFQDTDLSGELVFIIDPIDGTANFVSGFQMSCISIAAASKGELLSGVIYNPFLDELFYAEKGQGAFCNEQQIHVTDQPLERSLVLFGTSPYNPEYRRQTFALAEHILEFSSDIRRTGSAAMDLCYAAAGRVALYFECILSLWDYAAGILIVQEAGGICRTLNGEPIILKKERQSICAGTEESVNILAAISRQKSFYSFK